MATGEYFYYAVAAVAALYTATQQGALQPMIETVVPSDESNTGVTLQTKGKNIEISLYDYFNVCTYFLGLTVWFWLMLKAVRVSIQLRPVRWALCSKILAYISYSVLLVLQSTYCINGLEGDTFIEKVLGTMWSGVNPGCVYAQKVIAMLHAYSWYPFLD